MVNNQSLSELSNHSQLIIWDQVGVAPQKNCTILYWSEYPEIHSKVSISIADLVDKNCEELRTKYLSWVYDFGKTQVNGKSIIERLTINTGFSYWWATSIAQKFNFSEDSQINNAIKVLAFEDLIKKNKFTHISIASNNNVLVDVIRFFCSEKGLTFEKIYTKKSYKFKNLITKFSDCIPDALMVFFYMSRYMIKTFHMNFQENSKDIYDKGNVTFVDVLVHLDNASISEGKFKSNYWTTLIEIINDTYIKTNWLHIYYKHTLIPNLKEANQLIKKFNSNKIQFHDIVEQQIRVKNLIKIISNYLAIRKTYGKLKNLDHIRVKNSQVNIWHLHKKEWKTSLCGIPAINTCLKISQFIEVLSRLPTQNLGIYISENQPWELALIHAWKLVGHKTLIGVPHTTIRYWDLRYFNDNRSYLCNSPHIFPMPDALAVNGPIAYDAMISGGYPESHLVKVEALRYLYLNKNSASKKSSKDIGSFTVLICGDFSSKTNIKILSWVKIASQTVSSKVNYIFKPHPAYSFNIYKYGLKNLRVSNENLEILFSESDVAITSNISSVAVDAYFYGLKLIQVLDGNFFNSSPLLKMPNITYVKNPHDISVELNKLSRNDITNCHPKIYFNLDKNLTEWKKILKLTETYKKFN